MSTAVKVSGMAAACAAGMDRNQIYHACLEGSSAVNTEGLAVISLSSWNHIMAAAPPLLNKSKCTALSSHVFQNALQEANWSPQDLQTSGFIFATTTGQIDQWEKHLPFYRHESDEKIRSSVASQSLGTPMLLVAEHFGIGGPKTAISSSCSASLQALALATMWIRSGRVQRCVVGATEILCDLTRVGFGSLRLLSKTPCRPFDQNRNGINLGEGSAFVCLEKADTSSASSSLGYVQGVGYGTDAYHATAPDPTGRGSTEAMSMALRQAQLAPQDIDWIYAHGTGSQANDFTEAVAIQKIFSHSPWVSSTKSIHGHTLGACGVLESILGLMAVAEHRALPNHFLQTLDSKMNLKICVSKTEHKIKKFLKNSLGFGGINAAVIFSKDIL